MSEKQEQNGERGGNPPAFEVIVEGSQVRASIFENQRANGTTTHNASFFTLYKDGEGKWQRSYSFSPRDLGALEDALTKVREVMQEKLGYATTQEVRVVENTGEGQRQAPKQRNKQNL